MSDQSANTTQTAQSSSSQQAQSTQQASAGSSDGSQTTQQAASRPDWLPEAHWDAAGNTIKPEFGKHFQELTTLKAAHDARLAARPEKAEGYELKFPEAFKPAIPIAFNDKDPRVDALRAFAHKNNWSQGEFSEALQIEAARVVAEDAAHKAAIEGEIKKLGANGTARVTAAKTWLASILGGAGAEQFMDRMALASDVELIEKMQLHFTSQGGAGINANGRDRDPPPAPKSAAERIWPNGFGAQAKAS